MSTGSSNQQTFQWINASHDLPDDEMTVLLVLEDGEVWTGFRDAGIWRYVSADTIEAKVTHWAEFPEPPKAPCSECCGLFMIPSNDPDGDVMNTPCPKCNEWSREQNAEPIHGEKDA